MKIALIGYGKMGKQIEEIALMHNHNISFKIDENNTNNLYLINSKNTDVAFEFTNPNSAVNNILFCFEKSVAVVCGTTGWYNQLDFVKKECELKNGTLFYSPNFSLGLSIFNEIAKNSSKIFNKFNHYKASIEETHHQQKLDKPSGTAISIAENVLNYLECYNNWTLNENSKNNEIKITSIRTGQVPGTHKLIFESDDDIIEINHFAKNRKIFAQGALLAAENYYNKKGVFNMIDLYNKLL